MKKKLYETNEMFWDLLKSSDAKDSVARAILDSHNITDAKLAHAEYFVGQSQEIADSAWRIFFLINKLEHCADVSYSASHIDKTVTQVTKAKYKGLKGN